MRTFVYVLHEITMRARARVRVCVCRLQDISGILSQAFNHVKSTNSIFQNNLWEERVPVY